jgi:uncharacterized protein (DUF362 family)
MVIAMIVINYGVDIAQTTYDTLVVSDIRDYLKKNMAVAIKPNLVVPRPAYDGATTHPQTVEGIIRFLSDFGISRIKIIESAWVGDCTKMAFQVCGYDKLTEKYNIPFCDLKNDSFTKKKYGDLEIAICDEALNTEFLINVPVLKAHCQTRMTNCMKNLKGCIPDSEKRRFHTLGLDKPIAVLNALLKPGYNVVDGICGDLSFEEGGSPVVANRILAGRDPMILDSYCAELIGYTPDEIGYLAYAKKAGFGDYYTKETELIELNSSNKPAYVACGRSIADKYSSEIDEDSACSACYSSLVRALSKVPKSRNREKIHIGQGFKRKTGSGLGIGNCAIGFSRNVAGCPPKVTDIVAKLKKI